MADEWEDVPGTENPIESADDGWEDVPGTENPDTKMYDASTGDSDYSDYKYGRIGRIADITGKSVAQGAARMIEGFGSLLDTGEDVLAGRDDYSGYGRDIVNWARPYVQGTEQYLQKEIKPDSGEQLYSDVVSGITGAAPMMFTGNIPGAIILGAADRFGQKISQVERAGGDSPKSAALASLIPGSLVDYAQYAPVFNKTLGPFSKILRSGAMGALGTAVETPFDMLSNVIGGTNEMPTMTEIGQEIKRRVPAGTITGGALGTFQAGADKMHEYSSNKAMAAKTGEYSAKIDALQADRAAADLTARANAEMRTDVPIGDLPSVNEQAAALGRNPAEFNQMAAAKYANEQAATKMGATEPIPEAPPVDVAKQPDPIKIEKPPAPELRAGDLASDTMDKMTFEKKVLDPNTITHAKDIPNFKQGANEKGILKELQGDISIDQRLPVTVLERLNGELNIVSGRHRLDLFQRKNEPIEAEVYREADGFTPEMARIKDAELNIRDGKGSTGDFARYFKFRNLTKEQAIKKALLDTTRGEDGFAIGTMASDEVYARHQYPEGAEGKLSDKQAAAIAKAAPNDAGLQKIGIKAALDRGTPPEMLGQVIKGYEIRRIAESQKTEQQVFKWADEDTAVADSEAATRVAFKEADRLDSQIALGRRALKDPEAAAEFNKRGAGQIDIKDPAAIALEIKKLQIESARLRKYTSYPELLAEINLKAGVKPSPSQLQTITDPELAAKKALENSSVDTEKLIQFDNSSEVFPAGVEKPFQSDDQIPLIANKAVDIKSKMSNIKDTAGMETITNSSDLKNKIKGKGKKIAQKLKDESGMLRVDIPNPFKTEGFKNIVDRVKKAGYKENPEVYRFFANHKNYLARNLTMADKFPMYKKSHEAALKMYEIENSLAWDHTENLRPFTLLNAKEKQNVTALMYELNKRGKDFQTTPENLKALELSDREVRGVMSVRKTMDNALEISRAEALKQLNDKPIVPSPDAMEAAGFAKADIEKIIMSVKDVKQLESIVRAKETENINGKFDELKAENYVPTGRYGKYGLVLYDKENKMPTAFIMNDNKSKLLNMLYKERASNPNLDILKSVVSPVPKAIGSEYESIHPDIVDVMGATDSHIPSSSFLNRFKKRNMIEGFEADLQRNLASYIGSHSKYIAGMETKRTFNQLNKDFENFYQKLGEKEKTLHTGLRTEIAKLQDYVMKPQKDGAILRKFMATMMLSNQVATITVNNLSVLNSLPVLNKYLNPESSFAKNLLTPSGLAKNVRSVVDFSTEASFAKAIGQTLNYYKKKATSDIKGEVGKDLYASMEQARKEGALGGSQVIRNLMQDANSARGTSSALGQKMSAQDALFFLNKTSEMLVRDHTYATAWNMYEKALPYFTKRGIEVPNRHEFAKRIVDETHANYSKAGTPNVFKGPIMKTASIFKLWPHNFFTGIKNSVLEGNLGAVSRYVGVLGSLGGIYAIPGVREMLMGAKSAGFDPDKEIKELIPGDNPLAEKVITKGFASITKNDIGEKKVTLPFLGEVDLANLAPNLNIRNSLSPEFIPKAQGDIFSMLGRFGMGATGDIADRFYRAYDYYEKGDVPKMLLQGIPRMQNMQSIYKGLLYEKFGVTDSNNYNILRDKEGNPRPITDREFWRVLMGFMPETISASNERNREVQKIKEENDNENINSKIARKQIAGESTDELVAYARENGLKMDSSAIKQLRKKYINPNVMDQERVGNRGRKKLEELNQERFNGMNE